MSEVSMVGVEAANYQRPTQSVPQQREPEVEQQPRAEQAPPPEPRPDGSRGNNVDVMA
ncbi:MAG: hypothetical protein HQL47_04275 [Gammaproteobacteria bacterium]|nr:hypothetical protein [Gammaproteobacteria bacterium]